MCRFKVSSLSRLLSSSSPTLPTSPLSLPSLYFFPSPPLPSSALLCPPCLAAKSLWMKNFPAKYSIPAATCMKPCMQLLINSFT